MNPLENELKAIFSGALEHPDRSSYLDRACEGNPALRSEVESLLKAHDQAGGFLGTSPDAQATADVMSAPTASFARTPILEGPGTTIGPYKLLQQIGEGGMGVVFMAEQEKPVRRKVALKVIKPGMDTNQVVARFEAERQALAMMDHPNIARVLDVGATSTGRPYFVMELVKGVPITEYCDRNCLSPKERLQLFMPVCRAIQHAHQKGIIHRDIKPSNVLVTLHDGQPVPKVIDFGVAKAIDQRLTERTMFTEFGAVIGTLEYMSPEQAEMGALDIDTRSDIYSLGVLLYELLTGSTPLERAKLRKAAFSEVLRRIREEEPNKPSTRLSESNDALPSISAQRKMEPARLTRLVKGDLDWIVMKSLEKDRTRRYETATGFARDIQRYLDGDAVEACPPSMFYNLRKFARKHRAPITTALAFVGLLIAAVGISAMLTVKARRAEIAAEKLARESDKNAKEAEKNSGLYRKEVLVSTEARFEAERSAFSIQLDLDLAEIQTESRTGLLRLAGHVRTPGSSVEREFELPDGSKMSMKASNEIAKLQLNEFATMAILAYGQTIAPLLTPINHGGLGVYPSILSATGERLLTGGLDKTARLWETVSAKQIAILREGSEKVIEIGFSPDGATAFTHALDGVVRLWETSTGRLRAKTEPRPDRLKWIDKSQSTYPNYRKAFDRPVTQLSHDRILTWTEVRGDVGSQLHPGPAELWDARTGRLVARLELPKETDTSFEYFGDGRWIRTLGHLGLGNGEDCLVFSAEDGRLLTRLKPDQKGFGLVRDYGFFVSPSGKTLATMIHSEESKKSFMQTWDTTSWRATSITGPFVGYDTGTPDGDFRFFFLDETKFIAGIEANAWEYYDVAIERFGQDKSSILLPDLPRIVNSDHLQFPNGVLFDARTVRRLNPPKGQRYHPDLVRYAPDGRFIKQTHDYKSFLVDLKTEKRIESSVEYFPRIGWVSTDWNFGWYFLNRLPSPDHLNIPPDLLELWVKVVVRGELDDEGIFVKWDEPNWERKRQELASKPAPYPDFPFPGYVATNRLHWLRKEYEAASDSDKPRLAEQLQQKAEDLGETAEGLHWRGVVELHWLRKEYEATSDSDKPRLAEQLQQKAEDLGETAEGLRWRAVLDKLKK